jgi:hypothetical protein
LYTPVIPESGRWRQKDYDLEDSLGSIARLKKRKKNMKKTKCLCQEVLNTKQIKYNYMKIKNTIK